MNLRDPKDGPWCWQNKNTLKSIIYIFDDIDGISPSSAIAVYNALTHISSNIGIPRFKTSVGNICKYSGLGKAHVKRIVKILKENNILEKFENRSTTDNGQQVNTYCLTADKDIIVPIDEVFSIWYTKPESRDCNNYYVNEENPNISPFIQTPPANDEPPSVDEEPPSAKNQNME